MKLTQEQELAVKKKFGIVLTQAQLANLLKIDEAYKMKGSKTDIKFNDLESSVFDTLIKGGFIDKDYCCGCLVPDANGRAYIRFINSL